MLAQGRSTKPSCLAIVILDYNRPEMTNAAIRSISPREGLYIIVVENGRHASAESLDGADSIIEAGSNRGFSAGMNIGIRKAISVGFPYVALLNNDTVVNPGAIDRIIDVLDSDSRIGLAVPSRLHSVGLLNSKRNDGQASFPPTSRASRLQRTNSGTAYRIVRSVTGFCMVVRAQTFLRVGLLDEDFFFGKEDDEFSDRLTRAGYALAEVPAAIVRHWVGSSTSLRNEADAQRLAFHSSRGNILLSRKKNSSLTVAMCTAIYESARVWMKTVVVSRRPSTAVAVSAVRGMVDGARSELHLPETWKS